MADSENTTVECPTCGRDDFKNQHGVNTHRAMVHDYKVELECEWCGGVFERPPHKSDVRFCSRACIGEWNGEQQRGEDNHNWDGGPVELECESCGDVFEVKQNRADSARVCSHKCEGEWISENRSGEDSPSWKPDAVLECEYCGGEFKSPPSIAYRRRFCSEPCRHKALSGENHPRWAGGHVDYGPGWDEEKREAVRERDGRECQHCGKTEAEHLEQFGEKHHVHHIQKARELVDTAYDQNDVENLITLCRKPCHPIWERMSPLRPEPVR